MFCRHVFGNISGGFSGILRFLGNFAEIPELSEALSPLKTHISLHPTAKFLNSQTLF